MSALARVAQEEAGEGGRVRAASIFTVASGVPKRAFNIIAAPPWEGLAMVPRLAPLRPPPPPPMHPQALAEREPCRFAYRRTTWGKFADSQMDDIQVVRAAAAAACARGGRADAAGGGRGASRR